MIRSVFFIRFLPLYTACYFCCPYDFFPFRDTLYALFAPDQAVVTPTPSDIASAEGYPAALPTQPPTPSDGDAGMEKNTDFRFLSMGEYADLTASFLSRLPEETVVHRMTGDGPRNLLIGPLWSTDKKRVLNLLHRKIAETPRLYGAAVNLSLHPQSRS